MKNYVKPAVVRHTLLNSRSVANTCWGYHKGGSPTWYYDKNGTAAGFIDYSIQSGDKCGEITDLFQVRWYQNRNDYNNGIYTPVSYGDSVVTDGGETVYPFNDLYNYLISLGGSQGQNFSGEDKLIEDDEGMS